MKNYKLEEKLNKYISEPRNPDYNFGLACEYFDIKQYAAALSYYLRCAEISKDSDFVYESLLCSWDCMSQIGRRSVFERGQLLQTIAQSPHRPEAYYNLCYWLEYNGKGSINSDQEKFHQMYSYSCIGINNMKNNKTFKYFNKYPGYYGLMFYKAYSGWGIGKTKESEDIFVDLYNNHKLDDNFKQHVYNNIKNLNIEHRIDKNNKKYKKGEYQHWDCVEWPTLEINTIVPKKGCVVDCVFCPQRTLQKAWNEKYFTNYEGRTMTLDQFKMVIDKIPKEIRICFSGFVEPFMNKYCSDMILYAHEQGHKVAVFTTGVGMSLEDVNKIKNLDFSDEWPNGGFTLHLPDEEKRAKHKITDTYIKVIEELKNSNISNFITMTMGKVHNKVEHLYPDDTVNKYEMWHRTGNLIGEAQLKPELYGVMDEVKTISHDDKRTCGCPENLYHSVLLPNGDVTLCCMDYSLSEILGNLYTQEYDDIMPKKNTTYDICSRCENGVIPIN